MFAGVNGMGFVSYCSGFYRRELAELESAPATEAALNYARRLLRVLDDLSYEGYNELAARLEAEFFGVTRLRGYLKRNHTEPFAAVGARSDIRNISYSTQETELMTAVLQTVNSVDGITEAERMPMTDKLQDFCRWVGYDDKTAYIFLLRDMLLPFVYYYGQGRERIYPWLLSRSSFEKLVGRENADDEIRGSVYKALEAGCTAPRSFFDFVLPDMKKTIARCPQAEAVVCSMLESIDSEKIIAVESGCSGTFPLLLMSLDSRVDMRMYTSYPFLAGIFDGRIYTSRYEENRILETAVSHELYFRFSDIRDGRFYVCKCTDADIEARALKEIGAMLKQSGMK